MRTNSDEQNKLTSRKPRAYVYAGEPIPQSETRDNAPFKLNIQKAILSSLTKRSVLTLSQAKRCLEELEKQD